MDCTVSRKKMHRSQCDRPLDSLARKNETVMNLIDHLLQLLHGQGTHSLGGWLGLEHAWLLGEWVDSLASWASWLLFELQVQAATNLEGAVLLELGSGQLHVVGHNCLNILGLQASLLSNGTECAGGSHGTTGLHGLHRLHSRSH